MRPERQPIAADPWRGSHPSRPRKTAVPKMGSVLQNKRRAVLSPIALPAPVWGPAQNSYRPEGETAIAQKIAMPRSISAEAAKKGRWDRGDARAAGWADMEKIPPQDREDCGSRKNAVPEGRLGILRIRKEKQKEEREILSCRSPP